MSAGRKGIASLGKLIDSGGSEPVRLEDFVARLDPATRWHGRRVACLACRILYCLGREPSAQEWNAFLLHDVGKAAVPGHILNAPRPLTPQEWNEIVAHPLVGARLLSEAGMTPAAHIVAAHHERVDGSGYPHALSVTSIPMAARILAVADAYDAMTSDRVYRRAMGSPDALQALLDGCGTQFDEDATLALFAVVSSPARPGADPGAASRPHDRLRRRPWNGHTSSEAWREGARSVIAHALPEPTRIARRFRPPPR